MFCSSCGLEIPHELVYCSRCGNNLRPVAIQTAADPARFKGAAPAIATVIVLVTLGGFAMIFGLVMALITRGINLSDGGVALLALSLIVILAVDWQLVRLLTRILHLDAAAPQAAQPAKLPEPVQRRLEEPHVPVDSVTDHTTRTLTPAFVERDRPE